MIRLLSPLRFSKVWGEEVWLASSVPGRENMPSHPLLLKIIRAESPLSVQVHPDNMAAAAIEGGGNVGKTECWFILSAEETATITLGFKAGAAPPASLSALEKAALSGEIEGFLRRVPVAAGDFAFIPAGTIHAIGAGVTLFEVQQSCDLTYRLFDYGRGRPLEIAKAFRSIKAANPPLVAPLTEFSSEFFSLKRLEITPGGAPYKEDFGGEVPVFYFVSRGSADFKCASGAVKAGVFDTVIADEPVEILGSATVIKVFC